MKEKSMNLPIDKELGKLVEKLAKRRGVTIKELVDEIFENIFMFNAAETLGGEW